MKRILLSLITVAAVAAVAFGASQAFFSDTETSVGNTFVAGALDLQIDNTSYAIDYNIPNHTEPVGAFVASNHTTWTLTNLTVEKFFDFVDLKPGDYGEDTISLHVENDAWLCAATRLTEDADNSITEPEDEVFGTNVDQDDGTTDGDLDSGLQFAFWVDDGDNIYEPGQGTEGVPETVFLSGPLSNINDAGQIALADINGSILGGNAPIPGGTTFYIGKFWCYGDMVSTNLVQDGVNTSTPLDTQGTGWDCDGSVPGNIGQTDSVVGDLEFYAEQSRNNTLFTCDEWTPSWGLPN